jgi:hypothetical protein
MRTILAAAVLLMACGGGVREPATLGDYAEILSDALADMAMSCAEEQPSGAARFELDARNAEKLVDRFCAFRDAHDAFTDCDEPFEFDMGACLDALDAAGCVNIGTPESCPSCGFSGLPTACRAMWDASFHG